MVTSLILIRVAGLILSRVAGLILSRSYLRIPYTRAAYSPFQEARLILSRVAGLSRDVVL